MFYNPPNNTISSKLFNPISLIRRFWKAFVFIITTRLLKFVITGINKHSHSENFKIQLTNFHQAIETDKLLITQKTSLYQAKDKNV